MKTTFLGVRKPTSQEKRETEADLIFMREDSTGREYEIYVSLPTKDYGWNQWGESTEILGENVDDLERYLENKQIF